MDEIKQADFVFESFQVPDFSAASINIKFDSLNLSFDPFGNYDENTGEFRLTIKLTTTGLMSTEKAEIIKATVNAIFRFPSKPLFENIPSFFYTNSIAIVFPYFRGFISNLTLQANVPLIILPTLNLSALEPELRNNTQVVRKTQAVS